MQNYMYSAFSLAALVLHLIFNGRMLFGRRLETAHGWRRFAADYLSLGRWPSRRRASTSLPPRWR